MGPTSQSHLVADRWDPHVRSVLRFCGPTCQSQSATDRWDPWVRTVKDKEKGWLCSKVSWAEAVVRSDSAP